MKNTNKRPSQANPKIIFAMLLNIGVQAKLSAVKQHCERAERGLAEFDRSFHNWFDRLEGGEFDFRPQPFVPRTKPVSKMPVDVLKRMGVIPNGQDYTSNSGQELGMVPLDSMDLVETSTLYWVWNMGIGARKGTGFGPTAVRPAM